MFNGYNAYNIVRVGNLERENRELKSKIEEVENQNKKLVKEVEDLKTQLTKEKGDERL